MTLHKSACGPHLKQMSVYPSLSPPCSLLSSRVCSSSLSVFRPLPLLVRNAMNYKRCMPVCLFGDKGKSKKENEPSPWESLEKAMGGLKRELSVQDILREQMQERDFEDDGGSGNRPGGGGDGEGSGDSEDEGLAGILDELLQVVLATLGFIFMYIYIIRGEELTRLAKDYIKYLFGARTSVRLRRAMYVWGRLNKRIRRKKVESPNSLQHAIRNTSTWWYTPSVYRRVEAQLATSSYKLPGVTHFPKLPRFWYISPIP